MFNKIKMIFLVLLPTFVISVGLLFLISGCYDYKNEPVTGDSSTNPTPTSPTPTTPTPTPSPTPSSNPSKYYVDVRWGIIRVGGLYTLLGGAWYFDGSLTNEYIDSSPSFFYQYWHTYIVKEGQHTTSFKLTNQTSSPNEYTITLAIAVEEPVTSYGKYLYPYDEKRSLKTGEVISYTFNVP